MPPIESEGSILHSPPAHVHDLSLLDDSLTPVWMSMYLGVEIPHALISYEFSGTAHHFLISHDRQTYRLCLASSLLSTMDSDKLMRWLRLAADRVLTGMGSSDPDTRYDSTHDAEAA